MKVLQMSEDPRHQMDMELGMDKKEDSIFDLIEDLKPIDPETIVEFRRAMNDEVIPEIVRVVEERRMRAAESRKRQLKC